MSDAMQIRESEGGMVRLFALDLPQQAAQDLADGRDLGTPEAEARIREMLGAEHLELSQVELFPVDNLEGLGLAGYLEQGHAIPAAEISDHRAMLDNVGGWVVLVPSRAFGRVAQTIRPTAPLRWIATFSETPAAPIEPTPRVEAAKGSLGAGGEPGPTHAPRLPFGLLIVLLLLVLGVGLIFLGAVPFGGDR